MTDYECCVCDIVTVACL